MPSDFSSWFSAALTGLGPFGPAPRLAVAVSGGADSLALTLLTADWVRDQGGQLTALTVDHGLRPESRAEAEFVAAQLAQQGIVHHILTPAHAMVSNNLQEAARGWRYEALARYCRDHDILHCLLAHHAGDQRETSVLHEARGSTADGPSGMAAVRGYQNVRFLRPLLGFEKETLMDVLRTRAVTWVEDPSNQNPRFARVRVRQALAENPADQTSRNARTHQEGSARATRDGALADATAAWVTLHPAGYAELPLAAWRALEPALASRLIADLLTTIGGQTKRPRQQETERLCTALLAPGFRRRTLHGCELTVRKNMLRIAREPARVQGPVNLTGHGRLVWDNRFHVQYTLPPAVSLTLRALGADAPRGIPAATPSLWLQDACVVIPHITPAEEQRTAATGVRMGFAPAKPLAAAPFWWLTKT